MHTVYSTCSHSLPYIKCRPNSPSLESAEIPDAGHTCESCDGHCFGDAWRQWEGYRSLKSFVANLLYSPFKVVKLPFLIL